MESIDNDPGIIDLIEKENIKQSFEDANKKLDRIQKSLNEYLEEKRLVFMHFFKSSGVRSFFLAGSQ